MLELTRKSMEDIARNAIEHKNILIVRSLRSIFHQIYTSAEEHVNSMRKHCEERLKKLEDSRLCRLDDFISRQKDSRISILYSKRQDLWSELDILLEKEIEEIKKRCEEEIFVRHTSEESLKDFLKTKFSDFVKSQIMKLRQHADDFISKFSQIVDAQLNEFEADLQKEFRRLSIIPLKLKMPAMPAKIDFINIDDLAKSLISCAEGPDIQGNRIAGALIGGVIGSIFTLGIGTAIGASIGAALGYGGEKKGGINGVRERLRPQFNKRISEILPLIKKQLKAGFNDYSQNAIISFTSHLNQYSGRYESAIDKMIVEEKQKQAVMRNVINGLEDELASIDEQKNQIGTLCRTI